MSGNFARQTGMTRPSCAAPKDRAYPVGRLSQVVLPVARRPIVHEPEAINWDSPDVRPIRLVGRRAV